MMNALDAKIEKRLVGKAVFFVLMINLIVIKIINVIDV